MSDCHGSIAIGRTTTLVAIIVGEETIMGLSIHHKQWASWVELPKEAPVVQISISVHFPAIVHSLFSLLLLLLPPHSLIMPDTTAPQPPSKSKPSAAPPAPRKVRFNVGENEKKTKSF